MSDKELIAAVAARVAAVDAKAERDTMYTCKDGECLSASDWTEAVSEVLQEAASPDDTLAEILDRLDNPVTLTVYERSKMPSKFVSNMAENAVENAVENWGDDYGDPNGRWSSNDPFEEAAYNKAVAAVEAAFAALFETQPVWSCDQVGTVEISHEELAALIRDEWPDFDDDAKQAATTPPPPALSPADREVGR